MINMDPAIAEIFSQSTSVSTQKGVSSNLMKIGAKRRRTKIEIEEEKLLEQQERNQYLEKLDQIEKMQEEMNSMKIKAEWADNWENRVSSLADEGKLKILDDGRVDIVHDPEEQRVHQESRRKEKLQQQSENQIIPQKLDDRFEIGSD